MYVLDSNVYIRALQVPALADELKAFETAAVSRLWVSAVVMFEVEAGARDQRQADAWERQILQPFRTRHRVLLPSASTWRLTARIDRAIRVLGGFAKKLDQRSFLNDMLIAATCREVGATLITANRADFALIDRVMGFWFVTSFPERLDSGE